MSNPGPASTQTPVQLFGGSAADGIQLGGSAAALVAFHNATPCAQAGAITNLANDANGTAIATAVNAILVAMRNKGLIAS